MAHLNVTILGRNVTLRMLSNNAKAIMLKSAQRFAEAPTELDSLLVLYPAFMYGVESIEGVQLEIEAEKDGLTKASLNRILAMDSDFQHQLLQEIFRFSLSETRLTLVKKETTH